MLKIKHFWGGERCCFFTIRRFPIYLKRRFPAHYSMAKGLTRLLSLPLLFARRAAAWKLHNIAKIWQK